MAVLSGHGLPGDRSAARAWVLSPPFRPESGSAWLASLPSELHELTDCNDAPRRSRLRLLEDGKECGRPHSPHRAIREPGRGRYSFWVRYLFFSTSDDSDPNMNGRTYTAILPEVGPEQAAALAASAALTPELAWQAPNRRLRCAVLGMGNRGIALAGLLQSFAGVDSVGFVTNRRSAWLRHRNALQLPACRRLSICACRSPTPPSTL